MEKNAGIFSSKTLISFRMKKERHGNQRKGQICSVYDLTPIHDHMHCRFIMYNQVKIVLWKSMRTYEELSPYYMTI